MSPPSNLNTEQKLPRNAAYRLRLLDVLDRVTQVSLASESMDEVMRGLLDLVLEVFEADRAWFLFPCDPAAPTWSVPLERTRPQWPGLFTQGVDIPMDSAMSGIFGELLGTEGAIQYGSNTGHPVPALVAEQFSVKSQMMVALRPKIGNAWVFGLHHCEREVIHDNDDLQLFTSLAHRVSDTLSVFISTRQLRESEERWKFALEGAGEGVWDWNPKTDDAMFSKRWKEMIGYAEDEFPNKGAAWVEHLHPDDKDRVLATVRDYFAGNQPFYVVEFRMRCKDGSWKWILARGKLVSRDAEGSPLRIIGMHTDISERKLAENQLHIAAIAFEAQEGIMITDADNVILRVNRSFTSVTGYTAEEVVGHNPKILASGRHDADFFAAMWRDIRSNGGWDGEIWNRRKNGEVYPERLNITAVKDHNGDVTNYVATIVDFTMNKASEEKIKRMAFYDHLTLLPNRQLLMDRLKHALSSSARSGKEGALLFIDLDNFKTLNDTLGHSIGDLLLQQVAQRLETCVREGDTVSRFGGDEFVVLLENLSENPVESASQTETVCEKILAALNKPYLLADYEYHNTSSIGATQFSGHQQTPEIILKQADRAMYLAKNAGRNAVRFFGRQTG
jgi:diguanylate cyclase (GGDEF)-like protein/PAS domain S-box-containing protein